MTLGCLIIGIVCGAAAAAWCAASGLGMWVSLLAYSGTGSAGLCFGVGLALAYRKLRTDPPPEPV